MRWHARLGYEDLIVLARWVFLSVYFLDPPALWPASETTPPATDAPPVLHLVMPLLEQLHRDQAALRQAIDQLGARQEMAFDQQRQGMRDQLHAAQTLFAQREQDLESLRARNRATLTTVSLVAGVFVVALGGLAWSLLRTLQRFSTRMARMSPGAMLYMGEVPLLGPAEGRVGAVIEQMEQRLLKLENVTPTPAPRARDATTPGELAQPQHPTLPAAPPSISISHRSPPARTDAAETSGPLPGDFV